MKGRLALPVAWVAAAVAIVAHDVITIAMLSVVVETYGAQDTYFLVAHWRIGHSIIAACLGFAVVYAVLPLKSQLRRRLAWMHFGLSALGYILMFGLGWLLPFMGMPRRYEDYPRAFVWLNWLSSIGYAVSLLGLLVFVWLLVDVARRRRPEPI